MCINILERSIPKLRRESSGACQTPALSYQNLTVPRSSLKSLPEKFFNITVASKKKNNDVKKKWRDEKRKF